ncbi:uncharacterized protein LOC112679459 isoform X1 [Sipha flava]|uniref:Uncharacterized protein LOC112679459 isoform X1 n=2 Tax=Sipha flava TaxID=143950 RepID=A0A8B8F409_9HEMI|nr:uncharacterized protein LOC112679459 isoform X1 [Sipha flava]XP_025405038.1 uncharacterized protein LOC112679459 isoform X1 [Sipha flava]
MSKRKYTKKKSSGKESGTSKIVTSSITTMTLKKIAKKTSKGSSDATRRPAKKKNTGNSPSGCLLFNNVSDVNPRPIILTEEFKLRTLHDIAALRSGVHNMAYNIENIEYILRYIQGKIDALSRELLRYEQSGSFENL